MYRAANLSQDLSVARSDFEHNAHVHMNEQNPCSYIQLQRELFLSQWFVSRPSFCSQILVSVMSSTVIGDILQWHIKYI